MIEQVGPIVSLIRESASVAVVIIFVAFGRWYIQQTTGSLKQFTEAFDKLIAQQKTARDEFAAEMRVIVAEMRKINGK